MKVFWKNLKSCSQSAPVRRSSGLHHTNRVEDHILKLNFAHVATKFVMLSFTLSKDPFHDKVGSRSRSKSFRALHKGNKVITRGEKEEKIEIISCSFNRQ